MISHPDPIADAFDYARAVVAGGVVAGRLQRLACQRHIDDLQHAGERGFVFNHDEALRALEFFPRILRHSKGEFAGKPFVLADWQKFVVASLFGWYFRDDLRRYRKALLSVARKQGKTVMVAGCAAKLTYADDEPGAEVYCTATKEEQASIMFKETLHMVEQSPALLKRSRIRKVPKSITYKDKRGFESLFRPLGSDGKSTDGLNPHGILLDELHAWQARHRDFKERLESGSGARRQPMEIIITTAGDDQSQLWIEEDCYAAQVVEQAAEGRHIDDSYFAFVCRLDETDDPFDEAVWPKANPSMAAIPSLLPYLRDQAREAKNRPTETNKFLRFHCNQRTGSHEVLIPRPVWDACDKPLAITDGAAGHGGIDIGRSNDWAAVGLCFPIGDEWHVISRAWTCRNGGFAVDREPFRSWINAGLLECTEGTAIDQHAVIAWIAEAARRYSIGTWAFDPNFAKLVGLTLANDHGLPVFEFSQAPRFYNEAIREFEKRAIDKRIIHGGDPVLAWQVGNMNVYRNHKDEWMPDKSNRESKIDGVVAVLMAAAEVMYSQREGVEGSLLIT